MRILLKKRLWKVWLFPLSLTNIKSTLSIKLLYARTWKCRPWFSHIKAVISNYCHLILLIKTFSVTLWDFLRRRHQEGFPRQLWAVVSNKNWIYGTVYQGTKYISDVEATLKSIALKTSACWARATCVIPL